MPLLHYLGHHTILVIVCHRYHTYIGLLFASLPENLHANSSTLKAGLQEGSARVQVQMFLGPVS